MAETNPSFINQISASLHFSGNRFDQLVFEFQRRVEILHRDALVFAVKAYVVQVAGRPDDPVGRCPQLPEKKGRRWRRFP